MALVAATVLAAVSGGCATAGAGPTTLRAPQPVVATAPAASGAPAAQTKSGTPAAPAASAPPPSHASPATYAMPAAPPGVAPNDPRIDEALGGLDSKMPSGCRKYVSAWCRTTTIPDAYRLQTCASDVTAINSMVNWNIRKGGQRH